MLSGLFSITLLPTKRRRGDKPATDDLLQVVKESGQQKNAAAQKAAAGAQQNKRSGEQRKTSAEQNKPSGPQNKPSRSQTKPIGQEQMPAPPSAKITTPNSSRVLRSFGNSESETRTSSMRKIIADSQAFLDINKTRAPQPEAVRSSMIAVVNQTFTVLQSCAEELNDVLGHSELWISCTAPTSVSESEIVKTFRGRISSNCISIVIRGQDDRVDFLMLPADRVIGLSIAEKQYSPLMTFSLATSGSKIVWQVEGRPLTDERLERYTVELFKFFVEETRTALASKTPSFTR